MDAPLYEAFVTMVTVDDCQHDPEAVPWPPAPMAANE